MKSKSGRCSNAGLLRLLRNRRCTSNRQLLRKRLNAGCRLSLRLSRETGAAVGLYQYYIMHNKLCNNCLLVGLLLVLCWQPLSAQVSLVKRKQLLIGSWHWCQSVGKIDTAGLCVDSNYGRYDWRYVFTADGKFYESRSGVKSPGVWHLTSTELTLDYDDTLRLKRHHIYKSRKLG